MNDEEFGRLDYRKSKRQGAPRARRVDLDRLPPHSLEAEQGVLGCCLLAPNEVLGEVLVSAKAEWFYDGRHGEVFGVLQGKFDRNEPVDLITVMQGLRDLGKLEAVGGGGYLTELQDGVPSAANFSSYLVIVKEKFLLRRMAQACQRGLAMIFGDEEASGMTAEEVLAEIEKGVSAVGEAHVASAERKFSEGLPAVIDMLENHKQGVKQMYGIPTGFNFLDNMLCGLRPELFVIAGRPAEGKTSLMVQILEYVATKLGIPVGMMSLEMTFEQVVLRQVFGHAGANLTKLRNGFLLQEDVPKLTHAIKTLNTAPLYIDDGSTLTPRTFKIKTRRMMRKYGIKLMGIDYVQLLSGDKRFYNNRAEEISDVSGGVARVVKELGMPVIALAQLNRELEKDPNRKPRLSDLKESGSIEQDAHTVGILYRVNLKKVEDDPSDPAMRWLQRLPEAVKALIHAEEAEGLDYKRAWQKVVVRMNLLICKQRNGPTGDVGLVLVKPWSRFIDAYTPSVEETESEKTSARENEQDGKGWPI